MGGGICGDDGFGSERRRVERIGYIGNGFRFGFGSVGYEELGNISLVNTLLLLYFGEYHLLAKLDIINFFLL